MGRQEEKVYYEQEEKEHETYPPYCVSLAVVLAQNQTYYIDWYCDIHEKLHDRQRRISEPYWVETHLRFQEHKHEHVYGKQLQIPVNIPQNLFGPEANAVKNEVNETKSDWNS